MKKLVRGYMVTSPFTILPTTTVHQAIEKMRELDIRHLPVVENGELTGLVSDRDLREAAALDVKVPLKVDDVMKREVYVTEPNTSIREIVATMVESKIGSAVIVNANREIIGIFTTIDALRILLDILDEDEGEELDVDDYYEPWDGFGLSIA